MTTMVFVYGTLQKGQPNNHILTSTSNGYSRYVGSGHLVDKYPLVVATDMNIPFILDKKGVGKIISGDVYDVDEQMLAKLDQLEQAPAIYRRVKTKVKLQEVDEHYKSKDIVDCDVFVLPNFRASLLELPYLEKYVDLEVQKYTYRPKSVTDEEAIEIATQYLW